MIDHLELRTLKMEASVRFYEEVLAPLGYSLKMNGPTKGFGAGQAMDLFLIEGEPSANVHFAFAAPTRAVVDAGWKAGATGGHVTDLEPALAPHIHPNYYAGYLRDPDNRLVELVCQLPE
ncbi:MAG: hypothetical protein H0W65_05235 [Sphingomonas sp.]|uniref:VOC family protein n=1 Tax=Sphingomonas sp. TaxID=28214 RepID=UPI0017D62BED|nr:VOC family protein [Sphingomonas sp.]MBA3667107.1 hypothetical protein [Sphingomonas sp.]